MKNKELLNMPLEYTKLSAFFDAPGEDLDASSTNIVIEKILRTHGVKSVLDFSCGTGSQVNWLEKRDYRVTGIDISPQLLKIAKKKVRKKTKLFKGDMRSTQAGQFDAVITIWNAVGHLSKAGFEKAMRNIAQNLKDGGIYVFDIFNLNSMSKKVVADLAVDETKKYSDAIFHRVQKPKLDKAKGLLWAYDHFRIEEKSGKSKELKARFSLRIYTAKQLREMLIRNGFEVLAQSNMDGSKFSDRKSVRILTVAQKKSSLTTSFTR